MQSSVEADGKLAQLQQRFGANALAFIASVLIVVYIVPIFYFMYVLIDTNLFIDSGEDSSRLRWFIELYEGFLSGSSNLLAEIHQLTLPFVAAIAAIQYRNQINIGFFVVSGICFVGIIMAIASQVIIQTDTILVNLEDFMTDTDPGILQSDFVQYFRRSRETLFLLIMVLIGLQVHKVK